jgi:hypothetical protein
MIDWSTSLVALIPIVVFGGAAVYLGLRLTRASELRGRSQTELSELSDRVVRLEDALASLATEVQRIADAEQFTSRLLQERTASQSPMRPGSGAD